MLAPWQAVKNHTKPDVALGGSRTALLRLLPCEYFPGSAWTPNLLIHEGEDSSAHTETLPRHRGRLKERTAADRVPRPLASRLRLETTGNGELHRHATAPSRFDPTKR